MNTISTDTIEWSSLIKGKIPYTSQIITHTFGKTILFNGDFDMEDGAMPVERIAEINGEIYHVRILYKKQISLSSSFRPISEDQSDDQSNDLSELINTLKLTPIYTFIIEMDYEIIKKVDNLYDLYKIVDHINYQKEEEDKNEEKARIERLEQEEEERIYNAIMYRNSY